MQDAGGDSDETLPSADSRSIVKRRRIRLTVIILAGLLLALGYFYSFCNWARHSEDWVLPRAEVAITRGLDYLYATEAFARPLAEGGESPPHFLFLELVLERREHPGLRRQIARAKERNSDNWQWRVFSQMPGWPDNQLTADDFAQIRFAVDHSPKNYWAEWLLHSLYADWTTLREKEEERLFHDTRKLANSYQLTHALLAYLWLKRSNPNVARSREVDRLIREVNERLLRYHAWDPFTSDIYNERVAFWLYMDNPPSIRQRWIERIILSQNIDGGWTYEKSIWRTLSQFLGLDRGSGKSHPHATILALYALSEYAERCESIRAPDAGAQVTR